MHKTVTLLVQNQVLVKKWQEFVGELDLNSTDMVQWENSFNNRTITSNELFRHILVDWRSKRGRNATLAALVGVINKIGKS